MILHPGDMACLVVFKVHDLNYVKELDVGDAMRCLQWMLGMILVIAFDKVWVGDSGLSNIHKRGQHSSFVDADCPEFLEIFLFQTHL